MIEFYCKKDGGCHFQKPETQMAGPSMGAHVCDFSGGCEHQVDERQLYHHRFMHRGEKTYIQPIRRNKTGERRGTILSLWR